MTSTPLDEFTGAAGVQSRVALIEDPYEALALRLALIDAARDRIDAQYYIWDHDLSGRVLGQRLFAAADRGVQVRVLLDDVDLVSGDLPWLALDAHPNIAVRAFNPFRQRGRRALMRLLEGLLDFRRLNHRMHSKVLCTDASACVVGGRNIGNAYFGLDPQANFRDLDVLATGPAVADVRRSFEAFWDSEHAWPLGNLARVRFTPLRLLERRKRLDRFARRALAELHGAEWDANAVQQVLSRCAGRLTAAHVEVLTDTPDKLSGAPSPIAEGFSAFASAATRELLIESAYFVPGDRGHDNLRALRERGVQVRVTTNSLASTDVPLVHGAYAAARPALLQAGVILHEVKPLFPVGLRRLLRRQRSRASLHTKAAAVDRRRAFVGSMNLDPRSIRINTEIGLLIDCPAFAEHVAAALDRTASPDLSWQVEWDAATHRLRWHTHFRGRPVSIAHEPVTGWTRRLLAALARLLPERWL
jgi:putative cardiolipin synthase